MSKKDQRLPCYSPFSVLAEAPFPFCGDTAPLAAFFDCAQADLSELPLSELILSEKREPCKSRLLAFLAEGKSPELLLPLQKGEHTFSVLLRGDVIAREDGVRVIEGVLVRVEELSKKISQLKDESESFRTKLTQANVMVESLQIQAEQDPLTHLLNASTSRRLAGELLEESNNCAFLVIDMDDFKWVNDNFGHMMGDQVLLHAAQIIRSQFRSQDIVGRIGGDEFLVVMKDVFDSSIVQTRCSQLLESMRNFRCDDLGDYTVSCSIGAALSTETRNTYTDLFNCADSELYKAKLIKNSFKIAHSGE